MLLRVTLARHCGHRHSPDSRRAVLDGCARLIVLRPVFVVRHAAYSPRQTGDQRVLHMRRAAASSLPTDRPRATTTRLHRSSQETASGSECVVPTFLRGVSARRGTGGEGRLHGGRRRDVRPWSSFRTRRAVEEQRDQPAPHRARREPRRVSKSASSREDQAWGIVRMELVVPSSGWKLLDASPEHRLPVRARPPSCRRTARLACRRYRSSRSPPATAAGAEVGPFIGPGDRCTPRPSCATPHRRATTTSPTTAIPSG
jgi:hypothetical protein